MKSAKALMILGTASHVGKSLVTAGLGRIFSDAGIRVAPFKAQNMSLNSAATPDGREIGRAQALQAEACRVVPCAEMNPILIKPSSDTSSQIVVLGRVWAQVSASDYHLKRVEDLFPTVVESYAKLAAAHELILLEGAGSPAEINLREHDIVNMRMAHAADASCLLVADIDRGGVFASLLGTMELLSAEDRARIRGFAINKFRGDVTLLRPGIEMIEHRIGIPCAGVIHFLHHLGLEEEDSVALEDRRTPARVWRGSLQDNDNRDRPLRIGVVAFPHMANFTDFDALAMEPSVALAYLEDPSEVRLADVLILPGTKQTIEDLVWFRASHFDAELGGFAGVVWGVCGGFQMLGLSIDDPLGVENGGTARSIAGLGLLKNKTVMMGEKTVRQVAGTARGYEIHMGETHIGHTGEIDAASGRVFGTYVHGLFDDDAFRHAFIQDARAKSGLNLTDTLVCATAQRDARMDRWANHLRASLDLDLIRSWL